MNYPNLSQVLGQDSVVLDGTSTKKDNASMKFNFDQDLSITNEEGMN